MQLRRLIDSALARLRPVRTRPRRIRQYRVGERTIVRCPLIEGLNRDAADCATCEYSLGVGRRFRAPSQICGHGSKPRRSKQHWVQSVLALLRRLPMPKPYIAARFTSSRTKSRPLSRIQRRHRDRVQKTQQRREELRRARTEKAKGQIATRGTRTRKSLRRR